MDALKATLRDARNIDGVDPNYKEGAEFVAIEREARRRVDEGVVWSLEGDLKALGVSVGDDVRGLLTRVVAHNISDPTQDARAMRYGPETARRME